MIPDSKVRASRAPLEIDRRVAMCSRLAGLLVVSMALSLGACAPTTARVTLRFAPMNAPDVHEHRIVIDDEDRGSMPAAESARSRHFTLQPGTHRWRVTTQSLDVVTERRTEPVLEERLESCRTERWRARRTNPWTPELEVERLPDRTEPCYRHVGVDQEREVERTARRPVCGAELEVDVVAGGEYVVEYRSDGTRCTLAPGAAADGGGPPR